MKTPQQIVEIFEHHLAMINMPDEPQRLYAPIRYSLAEGGKRMRPVLAMLAYNIYADDVQRVLPAATAVEIFHNFTLLHDDIMDNAMVRRGRPSVFARWGSNVAILSGDVMMIEAYRHLQGVESKFLPEVFERFNAMAAQVCEGQQYDMDFETQPKVAVAEYMNMIELKTAALLSGSVVIGATIAGASEDDLHKLYKFATEVGIAFQLQDDLLDSYGDEQLGKKIGGDILEGKKTFLMVQAVNRADDMEREVLRTTHRDASLSDDEKISRIKALYEKLEVRRIAEQQIELRFERALSILDTLSIDQARTATLREFARNLMGRKK